MPVVNCAATLKKKILAAIITKQEKSISSRLAGRAVVRNGVALSADSVNHAKREVHVIDSQAKAAKWKFDDFFSTPVALVEPSVFLEPVRAADLSARWIGRSIFKSGERWQVRKISKQPESPELLLTLQKFGTEQIAIQSARELERDGWSIRRRARPTVSQRLSKVYAKEQREVPSPVEKLAHARRVYLDWRRR